MNWLSDLLTRAHQTLLNSPEAEPARSYLRSRGVDEDRWATYGIGYSAPSLQIGCCTQAFRDWFPKFWFRRLTFPLRNVFGTPIGVVTRTLPDEEGEKRAYQQFYAYHHELYPYAFGLDQAMESIWRTRQVVIVEGIFDYFAVAPTVPNTVAILTANVPTTLRTFFARYVKVVWAALDMDAPGRMGCYRLAGLTPPREYWPEGWIPSNPVLSKGYRVVIVRYDGAKDPGALFEAGRLGELTTQLGQVSHVAAF